MKTTKDEIIIADEIGRMKDRKFANFLNGQISTHMEHHKRFWKDIFANVEKEEKE